uniref:Protein FAR1-RELATED SEQUENCE n=1 Tax=Hordeum vulgare subsp. vulgare TaxID=112509 RepID=A0A8I6XDA5_HORVV
MEDTTRLHITEHEKDRSYLVYQAENYPLKERRKRQYLVQMDLNYEEYSCICCGFQKDGLLCSHILKVMLHLNREKIPEKYIIDRWRKSDQKIHSTDPPPIVAENSTLRYNVLQRKLVYVSSNASKKKRKYEYFLREIDRIQKRLEEMDEESESDMNVQSGSTRTVTVVATNIEAEETTSKMNIQDPDVSATKGRPRMLSIREAIKQNKFYKCNHFHSDRHTIKNCTNLDKEYNLQKRRRAKQSNPRNVKKGQKTQKKQMTGEEKVTGGRSGMLDEPFQQ